MGCFHFFKKIKILFLKMCVKPPVLLQLASVNVKLIVHVSPKTDEILKNIIKDILDAKYQAEGDKFAARFFLHDAIQEDGEDPILIMTVGFVQAMNQPWEILKNEVFSYFTGIKYTKEVHGFDAEFTIEGFENPENIDDFLE
jgi:hypothetical protein